MPQSTKTKENDVEKEDQFVSHLLKVAEENLKLLLNPKAKKQLSSHQSTLSSFKSSSALQSTPKSKPINGNKTFPFIKIENSPTPIPKPKQNNFELLKISLSSIKRFPIDDLLLIQYTYLIEKNNLLNFLENQLKGTSQKTKRQAEYHISPAKKQLKLTTSGTLKLTDCTTLSVTNKNGSSKELDNNSLKDNNQSQRPPQWPIPQSCWRVDKHLIGVTFQSFVFYNWYSRPLQISGFTLDQYEDMLGHGLGSYNNSAQNKDYPATPLSNLLRTCIVSVLNLIIVDRVNEGPTTELFEGRSASFEQTYPNLNDFLNQFVPETSNASSEMNTLEHQSSQDKIENPVTSSGDISGQPVEVVASRDSDTSELSSLDEFSDLSYDSDYANSDKSFNSSDIEFQLTSKREKSIEHKKPEPKVSRKSGLRNSSKTEGETASSDSGDESNQSEYQSDKENNIAKSYIVSFGNTKINTNELSTKFQRLGLLSKLYRSWWKSKVENNSKTWIYALVGWMLESSAEHKQFIEIVSTITRNGYQPESLTQSLLTLVSIEQRLDIFEKLQSDALTCDSIRDYMDLCHNESLLLKKDLSDIQRDLKKINEDKELLEKGIDPSAIQKTGQVEKDSEKSSNIEGQNKPEPSSSSFTNISKKRNSEPVFDVNREKSKLYKHESQLQKQKVSIERDLQRCQIPFLAPLGQDRFGTKYFYVDGIGSGISNTTSRLWVSLTPNYFINLAKGKLAKNKKGDHSFPLPDFVYKIVYLNMGTDLAPIAIGDINKHIKDLNCSFNKNPNNIVPNVNDTWLCYSSSDEIDSLISWLDPRGSSEAALLENLKEIYSRITNAMKRRQTLLEQEHENFIHFVKYLNSFDDSVDGAQLLNKSLDKSSLRLSDAGQFSSWSILSRFQDGYKHSSDDRCHITKSPAYCTFSEVLHSAYGNIPPPDISSNTEHGVAKPEECHPNECGVSSLAHSDLIDRNNFSEHYSSDSNNGEFGDRPTVRPISLRTRNKARSKAPSFVENYISYR
ncbi:hypothetical protein BB560_001771 [Smittium megazygosporum]|uniref:WHIM2 domain-containing protein n=1 Tax=Smittium megazygosporum TaxID=133381 RepID=A0A2T9ZGM4_9FUNG|nr:hypothetical protein BB560_001771 [Smittium megazygosporum]